MGSSKGLKSVRRQAIGPIGKTSVKFESAYNTFRDNAFENMRDGDQIYPGGGGR